MERLAKPIQRSAILDIVLISKEIALSSIRGRLSSRALMLEKMVNPIRRSVILNIVLIVRKIALNSIRGRLSSRALIMIKLVNSMSMQRSAISAIIMRTRKSALK